MAGALLPTSNSLKTEDGGSSRAKSCALAAADQSRNIGLTAATPAPPPLLLREVSSDARRFRRDRRARSALWSLDPGCNAGEHFRLAAAFANGGGDFEEFNRWSEQAHNYGSEGECRSVWKSASKPGSVTVATLFAAARAAGWTDGDEAPAKRPQSHQEKRQQPEASKPAIA
jgi:hypothetical protein